MPWIVEEHDGKFCVVNQMTGRVVHCHDTREKARAQQAALYANDAKGFTYIDIESEGKPPMSESDELVIFGGAVKALGEGKVGGYGVLFTSADDPDLQGDFFTKSTALELEDRNSVLTIWDHGMDKTLKRRRIGRSTYKIDDIGVWFETKLEEADGYEKAIYKLAELGKLGWSTGSAPHLVERSPVKKAFELKAWPIIEVSLTPVPVEPRTAAVPLKSLASINLAEITVEDEKVEPPAPFTLPSLDAITAPAAKSGDINTYSSEVATALEIFAQHAGQMVNSLDPFCATVKSKQEFRFVKDGRTISKVSMGYLDDCWKHLTDAETAIVQGKAKIEDLRKTAIMTKSQRDAAQEAAKLQFEIFQRLTTAKEIADVN